MLMSAIGNNCQKYKPTAIPLLYKTEDIRYTTVSKLAVSFAAEHHSTGN